MLDKAIFYGKEKRKQYHIPARQNSMFCRCDFYHNGQHGYDARVAMGRLYNGRVRKFAAMEQVRDYYNNRL